MGILSSIADTFGLQPELRVRPLAPLCLAEGGRAQIQSLPPGRVLQIKQVQTTGGWLVRLSEVNGQSPIDEPLGPVLVGADERNRMAGLQLDHDGDRWLIRANLRVNARSTPNPNSRLYLTNRQLAHGGRYFDDTHPGPDPVPALLAHPEIRAALFREHTVTIERTPGTPWEVIDRTVTATLRAHLLLCGGPLPTEVRRSDDTLKSDIIEVLRRKVLPDIHRDGGDLEVVDVTDGVVRVHLMGACKSCPASTMTLHQGVERTLKRAFPARVTRVESV